MTDARTVLEVRDLHAGYGGGEVIAGLSLAIHAREVVALLGLNGSGKSTLLRAALGLLPARAGEVMVHGENVHAMTQRERAKRISYIPQHSRIDEGMTVLDAVLMGANAYTPFLGSYGGAQRERAKACLAQLGLQAFEDRMMGTLSQGQRRLTVFARAMMQQPKVFLLDEPDGALDLPRRHEMMAHVRRMTREGGSGALAALHDASLTLSASDRVLILKDGRIACTLDMRTAKEETVREAMRLLYGEVKVGRIGSSWAVLG